MCQFFFASADILSAKSPYFGKPLLQNKNWLRVQDFVDKTLRLVRISLLISAIQRVLRFFSGNLFYKSNRKLFSCVCIAWYKHSRRWENSRRLCKPSTSSRVCITVSNSPNPSRVYIRLCKHGKRFLLLKKNLRTRALKRWHKKGNHTAVLHQLKSCIQDMWTNFLNEDKEKLCQRIQFDNLISNCFPSIDSLENVRSGPSF